MVISLNINILAVCKTSANKNVGIKKIRYEGVPEKKHGALAPYTILLT